MACFNNILIRTSSAIEMKTLQKENTHPQTETLLRWQRLHKLHSPSSRTTMLKFLTSTNVDTIAALARQHKCAAEFNSEREESLQTWLWNYSLTFCGCTDPNRPRPTTAEAAESFLRIYHDANPVGPSLAEFIANGVRSDFEKSSPTFIQTGSFPRERRDSHQAADENPKDLPKWWTKISERTLMDLARKLSKDKTQDPIFRACLQGDLAAFNEAMNSLHYARISSMNKGRSVGEFKTNVRHDRLAMATGWFMYRMLEASGDPEIVLKLREEERRIKALPAAKRPGYLFKDFFEPTLPRKTPRSTKAPKRKLQTIREENELVRVDSTQEASGSDESLSHDKSSSALVLQAYTGVPNRW